MTTSTTITSLGAYRNETPYPFCPGCGHGPILDNLNQALVRLELDPRKVVLVSDIGCSGLSDQYFVTSAFHGLHGRSITYASGIKLARPELSVIVIMGDGGTGIGGAHLINAARRNVGINVLVFNNFNFGMTGGQHSTTTPAGAVTSTTAIGNLEAPLDICATVAVNGAGYVYRGTSFDADLPDRIAEAVKSPGFALLDIWELCTAYYVSSNKLSKKALFELLDELGFATGVLQNRDDVEDYGIAYRIAHADAPDTGPRQLRPLVQKFEARLDRKFRLVVAGSAGEKVRSAVRLVGRAGILSGLWAAQREDYPVTVQTGHSLSELILSPEPIDYTGVVKPDCLVILSADGLKKCARYLAAMGPEDRVYVVPGLPGVSTHARVLRVDPDRAAVRVSRQNRSLIALAAVLDDLALFPREALEEAARHGPRQFTEDSLEAVAAGTAEVVGSGTAHH